MLNNVMIGRYYPINSSIHKMNPVSKILCTIIFVTMCFLANSLQLNAIMFLLIFLMMLNSHIPVKIYLKAIWSLKILIFFVALFGIIFKTNYIVLIIALLRIIYIVLYTTILTLTTPPTEITYGLEKVFSPLKLIGIPVNKMALSISLALRFIPTIIDQASKILKSQASRGVDYYNSGIKGKFISIYSLIIPMFVLTIKRADNLADAMEVRLYNVNKKRINFRQNKWGFFDTYLLLIHVLILGVIIVKGYYNEVFNDLLVRWF